MSCHVACWDGGAILWGVCSVTCVYYSGYLLVFCFVWLKNWSNQSNLMEKGEIESQCQTMVFGQTKHNKQHRSVCRGSQRLDYRLRCTTSTHVPGYCKWSLLWTVCIHCVSVDFGFPFFSYDGGGHANFLVIYCPLFVWPNLTYSTFK